LYFGLFLHTFSFPLSASRGQCGRLGWTSLLDGRSGPVFRRSLQFPAFPGGQRLGLAFDIRTGGSTAHRLRTPVSAATLLDKRAGRGRSIRWAHRPSAWTPSPPLAPRARRYARGRLRGTARCSGRLPRLRSGARNSMEGRPGEFALPGHRSPSPTDLTEDAVAQVMRPSDA